MNSEWADFLASQRSAEHAQGGVTCSDFIVGDLSSYGLIRVSGQDATTFLQGQVTCDVAGLLQDRWTWAAHCNAKGRVLANFLMWREAADLCLLLPRSMASALGRRLRMFVLRAKVAISTESDCRVVLGLGLKSPLRLQPESDISLDGPVGSALSTNSGTVLKLSAGRALVLASPSHAIQIWRSVPVSLHLANVAGWERLSVENAEPWVLPETQEAFVPQMLNLELLGAVSFSKGCYSGQEIVARTQHLGQVKRRLFRYRCAGHPGIVPNTDIFRAGQEGEPVGKVVNASQAEDGTIELLAVVKTAAHALPLRCPDSAGTTLTLQPLPYPLPPDA